MCTIPDTAACFVNEVLRADKPSVGSTVTSGVWILMHLHIIHACWSFPGPPNFGLSRQYLQDLQFEEVHPTHSPHLGRLLPLQW